MSEEQMNDSTFNRLFIIMIIAMSVIAVLLMFVATFAASDVNERLDARSELENSNSIAERIAPVGAFAAETATAAPVVVAEALTGEQAYASCGACHTSGVAGAPMLGDAGDWESRVTKGIEALYANAINGYTGEAGMMPAKGGNTALSDDSVKAAVDYMVEQL